MKATGKTFSVRGATVIQLRGGQIIRKSYYMNMAAFLQQVGLMPGKPK
jgi:ketosteroid isomerase-like protein